MQREKSAIERGIVGGNSGCISSWGVGCQIISVEIRRLSSQNFRKCICAFNADYIVALILKDLPALKYLMTVHIKGGGGGSLDLLGFLCVTERTLRSTAIIFLYTKLLNHGLQDIVFNRGAIIIILNSLFFILLSAYCTLGAVEGLYWKNPTLFFCCRLIWDQILLPPPLHTGPS
jgi:hypothetical protein